MTSDRSASVSKTTRRTWLTANLCAANVPDKISVYDGCNGIEWIESLVVRRAFQLSWVSIIATVGGVYWALIDWRHQLRYITLMSLLRYVMGLSLNPNSQMLVIDWRIFFGQISWLSIDLTLPELLLRTPLHAKFGTNTSVQCVFLVRLFAVGFVILSLASSWAYPEHISTRFVRAYPRISFSGDMLIEMQATYCIKRITGKSYATVTSHLPTRMTRIFGVQIEGDEGNFSWINLVSQDCWHKVHQFRFRHGLKCFECHSCVTRLCVCVFFVPSLGR